MTETRVSRIENPENFADVICTRPLLKECLSASALPAGQPLHLAALGQVQNDEQQVRPDDAPGQIAALSD